VCEKGFTRKEGEESFEKKQNTGMKKRESLARSNQVLHIQKKGTGSGEK